MAWIRSQDKEDLLRVERIQLGETRANSWALYVGYSGDHIIAIFHTKEAALAELDAIERWIDGGAQIVYQVSGG